MKENKEDKFNKMILKHSEIIPLVAGCLECSEDPKGCKTSIQGVKTFGTCGSSLSVRTSESAHLLSY